ncbi:MAG: GntR family transcriptional regulator [Fusobacterium mortiferum]|uniref:GntR family transcriptional regulator n=1 Tax=Fusobacterium mortiferum TaxID=850 RepID=UPI0022E94E70|nr:GntR family transcriptional regulator [Fusobacterium mortiferum]MCI7187799.1 GntR family transcriptional regulator [Fusobacterium mortiferum]MDY2800317.1 GntR family transcriptional regulator [Fusobacterium mortiferum]
MLENDIAIPLYSQLKDRIISAINNDELKYGEKIPTEIEIMEQYNVSRITVRRAIEELVEEGYLIKKQGKGTFVIKNKIERKLTYSYKNTQPISFTKELELNNIIPSAQVIDLKIIDPIEEFNKMLNINLNDKLIYMKRLRLANNIPTAIEINYFSYTYFEELLNKNLTGSLYKILEEDFKVFPNKNLKLELEVVKANDEQSKLLNIPISEPLFLFFGITADNNNNPIHIAKRYLIASKYKFSL